MTTLNRDKTQPAGIKLLFAALLSGFALIIGGCGGGGGEREADDGFLINSVELPTDVVLNLACENVGVHPETCVLDDPENPFANVPIIEGDAEIEGNKFALFNEIPAGPSGAKARFYLWATALARRASGENQYYTALALHELFDANSNVRFQDELVRQQALNAYRSVLDNFFGSVTVFGCCGEINDGVPVNFAVTLNERVADHIYRTESTGYRRLVEGNPLLVKQLFLEWGYSYKEATPPNFDDGVIVAGEF